MRRRQATSIAGGGAEGDRDARAKALMSHPPEAKSFVSGVVKSLDIYLLAGVSMPSCQFGATSAASPSSAWLYARFSAESAQKLLWAPLYFFGTSFLTEIGIFANFSISRSKTGGGL